MRNKKGGGMPPFGFIKKENLFLLEEVCWRRRRDCVVGDFTSLASVRDDESKVVASLLRSATNPLRWALLRRWFESLR